MNRDDFRTISQIAERQVPRFVPEYRAHLRAQVREAASAVRDGLTPDQLPNEFLAKWTQETAQFKANPAVRFGIDGHKLAGLAMGKKSFVRACAKVNFLDIDFDESVIGADELVANHMKPHVADWVEQTSTLETRTSAEKLQRALREAFEFRDDDGHGLTPRDIATTFLQQGLADSDARAELLTRTLTNWGYNEGAMTLYEFEGLTESEWLATLDDVTGEWDRELDGKRVRLRENFVAEGETFQTSEGAVLTAGIDVPHPPLRPNCRCTLVPVL